MNIDETFGFINSYSKSGKPVTDLSRAEGLMARIGNPEKRLKFVHIAGTNGKGSTVEYISNALIFSGYKTGQFTSPFILHYADRIRINGIEIDEKSLCELAETVKEKAVGGDYSQFEITMAIAFLWFERENCDVVVLECGIGGLLDCTNVIPPPLVSVITSISLDHTAILGDTVGEIAAQKAGIIKENSAVVLSMDNKDEVAELVWTRAKELNSTCIMVSYDDLRYMVNKKKNTFLYKSELFEILMDGDHQPKNAATAIEVCRYLRCIGYNISEENISRSIAETQVKARCQHIKGYPEVIVDGGHNPAGIVALCEVLGKYRGDSKIFIIMGMVDTKDYETTVRCVAEYAEVLFAVDGFAPNAVKAAVLAETAGKYTTASPCGSLEEAVEKAKAMASRTCGIVAVCGSLYLASEYLNKYNW